MTDLQTLRALAEAATPGPWKTLPEECHRAYIRVRGTRLGARYKIANVLVPHYDAVTDRDAIETRANAAFIAAANPATVLLLLDIAEAARAVNTLLDGPAREDGYGERHAQRLAHALAALRVAI
jgi:hypothetical protein